MVGRQWARSVFVEGFSHAAFIDVTQFMLLSFNCQLEDSDSGFGWDYHNGKSSGNNWTWNGIKCLNGKKLKIPCRLNTGWIFMVLENRLLFIHISSQVDSLLLSDFPKLKNYFDINHFAAFIGWKKSFFLIIHCFEGENISVAF